MGSIRRQSTQVIAKNSIKIRSFCLGTKTFSGVRVMGTIVELAGAAVGVEGVGVIGCSCATAQEAKRRVMKKKKI